MPDQSQDRLDPWVDSVLGIYRAPRGGDTLLLAVYQCVVSIYILDDLSLRVFCRKAHTDQILHSLRETLTSPRTNDEIAAELTDLFGFDEIELVMQILDNRSSISQQVRGNPLFPSTCLRWREAQ